MSNSSHAYDAPTFNSRAQRKFSKLRAIRPAPLTLLDSLSVETPPEPDPVVAGEVVPPVVPE